MTGASIEATLELWASSLRDVKERIRALFTQERVAASAGAFLDGLLGNERRKTGWMRAEAAGDPRPIGGSRPYWAAAGGKPMTCAISCAAMRLRRSLTMTQFWSSMKPDFSSRARPHAALRGNIPVRRARSPTAGSASSPVMSRGTAMPSLTGRFINSAEGVDGRSGPLEGGARPSLSRGRRKASRKAWRLRTGNAYRRAMAPRGRASTTGLMWNWPISRPANMRQGRSGLWTRGLLIRRTIADQDLAFFSTWAPAGASIEKLVAWKAAAGPLKTVSRRQKTSLALIITRPAPGMDGTATSPSSCWLSP